MPPLLPGKEDGGGGGVETAPGSELKIQVKPSLYSSFLLRIIKTSGEAAGRKIRVDCTQTRETKLISEVLVLSGGFLMRYIEEKV